MKMFRKYSIFKKKEVKKDKDLLVAAAVIAAMAYSAAISPPGGVASVDALTKLTPADIGNLSAPVPSPDSYELEAASSLLASFYPELSNIFWIANTISIMAALSVILLYVSGFSLKRHIQIWFLRVAMWITLSSMTVAYVIAVIATTPINNFDEISNTLTALIFGMIAWVALLTLSLIFLGFRFIRYIFTSKKKRQVPSKKKNTSEVEIAADIV